MFIHHMENYLRHSPSADHVLQEPEEPPSVAIWNGMPTGL